MNVFNIVDHQYDREDIKHKIYDNKYDELKPI